MPAPLPASRDARVWNSAVPFLTATLFVWLFAATIGGAASAREIAVGPQRLLRIPSQAALVAQSGDVVRIDRGTYADCAVWPQSNLTIEAAEPGVVLAGRTCQDKAIFVIQGANITVRGITFSGAAVIWRNGAGIRAEGVNLTVESSRFLRNENGILIGGPANSVVRVFDSEFVGNGSCEGACAHGVYAGTPIWLLHVAGCRFFETRIAHHVKSRAKNTIVENNRIEDGANGTASYLIDLPNGGNALIRNNILQKGRHSDNPAAAISIGVEGVSNATQALIVRDNDFASNLPEQTIFVRNSTTEPVRLMANRLRGKVVPATGPHVVEGVVGEGRAGDQ
jgi:hypothetical protein